MQSHIGSKGDIMNTLEQEIAQKVYQKVASYVRDHPDKNSIERQEYSSMTQRLPILVHTAGLVQALAFVADRGSDSHKKLLDHLADVIEGCEDAEDLLLQSRNQEFHEYRYLTLQVNIALTWFKRFAKSVSVLPGSDVD
jgi:CRISPR type III-B/RAMP module-associated protein Cmr5